MTVESPVPDQSEPCTAQPLVSIVTVTYNSAATLQDTLTSVRSQRYPHIEHIIVDGGSTDGTLDVVADEQTRSGRRLTCTSGPDRGIYDAMNKGIAMARGTIIGVLNSDDFLIDGNVITEIVEHFVADRCDALYADLVFVDQHDIAVVKRVWVAGRGKVAHGWNPPHPTLYVTKALYDRFGTYKIDYKISSDYDYMLRILNPRSGVKVSYLERTIVKMRHGGVSTRNLSGNRVAFLEAQQSLREQGVPLPLLVNAARVMRKLGQLRPSARRSL